jgi:hypothetical protein
MSLSHELHKLCEVIPALREEQFREKKPKMEMFYTGSTLYSKEAMAAMAIYIHLHPSPSTFPHSYGTRYGFEKNTRGFPDKVTSTLMGDLFLAVQISDTRGTHSFPI